ncbi:MAG: hypothetical protein ACRD22_19520 [Terriglobia bacterium]
MGLHLRFPACYAEAAMDTLDRNQRFRLCRSPEAHPGAPGVASLVLQVEGGGESQNEPSKCWKLKQL